MAKITIMNDIELHVRVPAGASKEEVLKALTEEVERKMEFESEDERIRKTLLRCCDDWEKGRFGCMAKEDVPAIRAYLEKQKKRTSGIILKAFENSKTDYSLEEREEASDYSEKVLPTSIACGESEEEYMLHKVIEAAYIAGQKEQKPALYWHKIKAYDYLPCRAYLWELAYEEENNFMGKCHVDGYLVPNEPVRVGCDTWYLPVEDIKNLPKEEDLDTMSPMKTVEQKPAERSEEKCLEGILDYDDLSQIELAVAAYSEKNRNRYPVTLEHQKKVLQKLYSLAGYDYNEFTHEWDN